MGKHAKPGLREKIPPHVWDFAIGAVTALLAFVASDLIPLAQEHGLLSAAAAPIVVTAIAAASRRITQAYGRREPMVQE